jgi:anti-sigma regulatory factor (Ser/Thr protein kinase)
MTKRQETDVSLRPNHRPPTEANLRLLLPYLADLELEVDRLRKQGRFVMQETWAALKRIRQSCAEAAKAGGPGGPVAEIDGTAAALGEALRDLQEAPGYHPAHDQVVAIAVRPLLEKVFRTQQRLEAAPQVELRLRLARDHVEWFPGRLRHLFDNLISNSLRYRDPDKEQAWIEIALGEVAQGYEFRVSDNGLGLPDGRPSDVTELFYRAAPARAAGLGVGLAVVKLLVEQSAGTLTVDSGPGQGTTFTLTLPRYELEDFLC